MASQRSKQPSSPVHRVVSLCGSRGGLSLALHACASRLTAACGAPHGIDVRTCTHRRGLGFCRRVSHSACRRQARACLWFPGRRGWLHGTTKKGEPSPCLALWTPAASIASAGCHRFATTPPPPLSRKRPDRRRRPPGPAAGGRSRSSSSSSTQLLSRRRLVTLLQSESLRARRRGPTAG